MLDREPTEAVTAGAQKEITYLAKHGRPLNPYQRIRREFFNYERQSHLECLDHLRKYLQVAQYLVPEDIGGALRPTIRHPDLQPNNIFVSDDLEITSLIDWQHCTILPMFLQGGIPNSLQNHGDEVLESLAKPTLPDDFDDLSEAKQFA